jgi:hypothetical protein
MATPTGRKESDIMVREKLSVIAPTTTGGTITIGVTEKKSNLQRQAAAKNPPPTTADTRDIITSPVTAQTAATHTTTTIYNKCTKLRLFTSLFELKIISSQFLLKSPSVKATIELHLVK